MSGNNKLTRLHVHADGLIVSKSDTGDDQPVKLTLASAESEIIADEVVGQIDFKSADGGAAGDGIVCASIQAKAIDAFDGTTDPITDPTKLSFLTRDGGTTSERMVITPQGVGIGTLQVADSVDLAIGDNDTGLSGSQGALAVVTNNVERMRVDSTGLQVTGLQVTKSGQIAEFQGSGSGSGHYIRVSNSNNPTSDNRTVAFFGIGGAGFAGAAGDTVISNYSYGNSVQKNIVFDMTGTSKMILNNNGNLGINTSDIPCELSVSGKQTFTNSNLGASIGEDYGKGQIKLNNSNGNACIMVMHQSQGALGFHFNTTNIDGTGKSTAYTNRGYIVGNSGSGNMNFTGQHRCLLNKFIESDNLGLIVYSTGKYVNIDNSINPSISESLPLCELAQIDNYKAVFGVIAHKEDSVGEREYAMGNFVSVLKKTNSNERRIFINSVGEGAIWVCNKNGAIENGDYVTSSSVVGYGIKQVLNEGILTNYTVAKLTQDCEFSLTKVVKQKLKVVVGTDVDGNTTSSIDYDADGNVLYEDDLDSEGNQQMVYPLDTRFLLADGTQLVDEADYTTRLGNGEDVYIACFVGCTYHCG